ncbi:Hexaprenyldihydroxybenzoate methyltransferase, mitochondrial [Rhizoclosmatium sp. JEL0117]|nr:Hexaprenyldihydroxybenzoate methyltransferase, mitochondrial [Rhizoclosmatium sp. JEL0117]
MNRVVLRFTQSHWQSTRSLTTSASSSINAEEVSKFAAASAEWWDPHGQFGMLHKMNPPRTKYIRDQVLKHLNPSLFPPSATPAHPFKGLRILDVGCGGGLLSESLARLGATVTGLDASPENTAMATYHASLDPSLSPPPTFLAEPIEQHLQNTQQKYDVVTSLEVIEHVNNPATFLKHCLQSVKPGGVAVFSTINRTRTSWLLTILAAEHVLKWVPVGTHDHAKYITPEELEGFVKGSGENVQVVDVRGIAYRVLENRWEVLGSEADKKALGNSLGFGDLEMNYIVTVTKGME